jgi:hypothetical protein
MEISADIYNPPFFYNNRDLIPEIGNVDYFVGELFLYL